MTTTREPRDRVTANLPARDFDETQAFYRRLGFEATHRDDAWMILVRGTLELEFFPHPDLVPEDSWFSACVRVADVDALHAEWSRTELPESGAPCLMPLRDEAFGFRVAALIDPNGSLLRLLSPLG